MQSNNLIQSAKEKQHRRSCKTITKLTQNQKGKTNNPEKKKKNLKYKRLLRWNGKEKPMTKE